MLSLAEALRNQYVGDVEESWIALGRQAAAMNAEKLTCRLVELQVEIMKNYPVLLTLLDVPPISHARRELIRTRIAEVLLAHQPLLCAQAGAGEAGAITDEFKAALTGYLVPKLKA